MPDREKVIDGIERLRFFNQRAGRELWGDKPAEIQNHDIADADSILANALSLLREQEARVMTREEVTATPEGTVVWMEEEAESGTYIQPIVSTGNGCLGNFYIGVGTYGVNLEKRRFWTSRPTPEQRRETPWEGEKDVD